MKVRILCGRYWPSNPFIEAGCMCDWLEEVDSAYWIQCPECGEECPQEFVQEAIDVLQRCVVFLVGCPHRAFTFSRRTRKPYFYPFETAEEVRQRGDPSDSS